MSTDGTTLSFEGDTDLVITRTFQAPPALVFRALHEPDLVRRWWAPSTRGTMTVCEIDFRVGGAWRFAMKTVSGDDVGFHGEYQAIDTPPKGYRVVQTEIFDPFPDAGSVVTVTLDVDPADAARTVMRQHIRYPSAEVRTMVISTGMEDGMRESMLQLTEVVQSLG